MQPQNFPTLSHVDAEIEARRIDAERRLLARNADAIRDRCRTLYGFLQEAWPIIEPQGMFVGGWAIKAICDHLEAITRGRFLSVGRPNRLRINVPPGLAKSLTASVAWNAWEWGPCGLPHQRFFSTSYSGYYVERDARRTRDLILSDWYQSLWPMKLVRSAENSFENDKGGTREGVPFTRLTSGRGDRLIIDDPLSVKDSKSAVERENARFLMRESVPNRINDIARSPIVLVQHRLHRDDPSGTWESLNVPHVALVLPMRFDPLRRCTTPIFADPRTHDGELLFPERFPEPNVRLMEMEAGAAGTAAQLQQQPTAREGLMFRRHWFEGRFVAEAPAGTRWVRHWDLAATAGGDGAQTAGVKLGRSFDGRYYVGHVVATREGGAEVRRLIKMVAEQDGKDVEISLPQDPGQAGKVQAQDLVAMLAGWNASAKPESGSKETRAQPFASQCEAGNVYLCNGADAGWCDAYIDQLCEFPAGKLKDMVDASSGAFGRFVLGETSTYDTSLSWIGDIPPKIEAKLLPQRQANRQAWGVD